MNDQLKDAERTDEIREIIERMPSEMGIKITVLIIAIVTAFFSLGWIVKYPDTVVGKIVINTMTAPIKLVANAPGKLKINKYQNYDFVKEGAYIAILQNAANKEDVENLANYIKNFDINDRDHTRQLAISSKKVSLGELNVAYYKFLNALTQISNYEKDNMYEQQIKVLKKLIIEYQNILHILTSSATISVEGLKLYEKFHFRDSILSLKKVLSEYENDKTQLTHLSAKSSHQNMLKEISNIRSQLEQTRSELNKTTTQNKEKAAQLELDLTMSIMDLSDQIKNWEQKYVFKAPFDGKIQFLKFWTDDQFIQQGEAVFTIVPSDINVVGQMTLPSNGAGKVTRGQKVIIKLEDYPYAEFGSLNGTVSSISLTTNPMMTKNGDIETYLVNVNLPSRLRTNYGAELDFKYEIKGTGDIITNDRRLIERLFDNLKYKFN